ncbi:MAG: M2 family metallopeptidase [Gemmatimonadetes bacterium]|nr:M2 family metallopeptidase [Gemmatimonadota bacterium]
MPQLTEAAAREWVSAHVSRARELDIASNLASWEAATTGTEDALRTSAEARATARRLYSDPAGGSAVRAFLDAGVVADPVLRRELVLLDLRFTENRLPEEVIDELSERESELERIFYTFRPEFEGEPASNNTLLDVLRHEKNGERRRAAWEASKQIGSQIAPLLRELVARRNAAARKQGFDNFYSMQLALEEIDEQTLFATLDEFRSSSDAPFARVRAQIDEVLAKKVGVRPDELYPWHWEDFFAQEAPSVGEVELDAMFAGRSLEELAATYFAAIGLPVEDVLARSDLYERPGKDQHAFCTDIDREGDVRVLCNLRDTERWTGTLLHELGHAAYDKFLPHELPYLLRRAGHTLLTEAVAMFMGRLTRDPAWLRESLGLGIDDDRARDVERQLGWAMLVSARWMLVMAYFERELYRDPNRADLNSLWWDLVESIQLVRRPPGRDEPDWAAKLHLSLAPVYYHNYLLGEFVASQLGGAIRERRGGELSPRDPAIGDFFRNGLFALGATRPWNELLQEVTGTPLSTRYFLSDFVTGAGAR